VGQPHRPAQHLSVIVETIKSQYPELIPYLAPIATPIEAEARYLKQLYGQNTPIVYTGLLTEGARTSMPPSPWPSWRGSSRSAG